MRPWLLIIPLVLLDLLTKTLTFGKHIEIFPFFAITSTQNTGILFGLFTQTNTLMILVTALVIGILTYVYQNHPQHCIHLSIILAGALGNLTDRILYGGVRDFLDFKIWPVFNLADCYLVIGIVLILVRQYRTKTKTF